MANIFTFVTLLVIFILCFHTSYTSAGGLKPRLYKRSLGSVDVKESIDTFKNILVGMGAVTKHGMKTELGSLKAKEMATSKPGTSSPFGTSTTGIASDRKTVR